MAEENISVSVRVRPLSENEEEATFGWSSDGSTLWPLSRPTAQFTVDQVYGPATLTTEIYESDIRPLIEKAVVGINATFFAYGQTSSGKTYTIQGVDGDEGVVSLAVRDLFDLIKGHLSREFLCRASYLEIYNEEINDLLCEENTRLPLHEGKDGDVYVGGLTEEIVDTADAVMQLLRRGESSRHTGATKMNERSSRSHTIFRMIIESRRLDRDSEDSDVAVWVSTLNLVDLAGAEGLRMKEGTAINKSLLNLGIVINQLAHQSSVISYRDSKLTRILQRSLGGNAKTVILCNITPAACHVEESSNTLRFGCRAKKVVNSAHVNEVLSDAALLKRQAKEIESLKKRLAESGNSDVEFEISQMRAALLRSEHEKELMQIKLDEEKAKKEKAERQVQVATQLMFSQEQELMLLQDRQKRRDTWCPGNQPQTSMYHHSRCKNDASESGQNEHDLIATPPSAKRQMKSRLTSERTCESNDARHRPSEVQRMSTEDVRQLVRDLVEEKSDLEKQLTNVKQDANQARAQIKTLEIDLKASFSAKTSETVQNDSESDKLRIRLAVVQLQNKELKMQQQIAARQIKKYIAEVKNGIVTSPSFDNSAENTLLKSQVHALQQEVKAMKKALSEKENRNEELSQQLEAKMVEIQNHVSALKDVEEEVLLLKQHHIVEMDELEKTMRTLRSERNDLESQVASKHEELSVTKKSKNESESQMTHLGKERDLQSREVDRLKKRLEEQVSKNKGLLRERVDLQNDKGSLQRQVKALERENATFQTDVIKKNAASAKKKDILTHELAKVKERLDEVTQERDAALATASNLQQQLDLKQNECVSAKTRLSEAEANLKQKSEASEKERNALQAKIDQIGNEAVVLQRQLQQCELARSESAAQSETTREELSKAKKTIDRLETAVHVRAENVRSEMEFRVAELSIQLQLVTMENKELRTCVDQKEDAYLQLELTLQTTEAENIRIKDHATTQATEYERERKNWTAQLETTQRKLTETERHLSSKEADLIDATSRIQLLAAQIESAIQKLENMEQRYSQEVSQTATQQQQTHLATQDKYKNLVQSLATMEIGLEELTVDRLKKNEEWMSRFQEKEEELLDLKARLETLESEHRQALYRLGAAEQEAAEWKRATNTTTNVEEWVKSLSDFIYELKFQSNQILADFDEEENHIPTKIKTEAQSKERVMELTEKLRSSKRAEMELYGVLRVMKEDIKKTGWEPDKLDVLLENSRKEYRHAYTEGKLKRLEIELRQKSTLVSKLEEELRTMRKQIPPKKLDIDLSQPPPERLHD